MALKDLTYFTEKDNLEGKKDIFLVLDCHNCPHNENDFFKSIGLKTYDGELCLFMDYSEENHEAQISFGSSGRFRPSLHVLKGFEIASNGQAFFTRNRKKKNGNNQ